MKIILLTALAALLMLTTVQAQQTVRRYLRLSDSNLNLNYFGEANSRNLAQNTLTLGDSWCAAGWSFESSPLDLSGYDKIVVRLNGITSDYEVAEDGGSAIEFRLFDANSYWDSQASVYCWRVMDKEMEFEIPLNGAIYKQNDEELNLQHVTIACFWCYAPCTIHIKEIYMEKTLKEGEMEFDTTPFPMTQQGVNYKSDDITVDETGWTFPIYTNESFAGWDWSAAPQDWSAYRYLVIVPQVPYNPSPILTKPFQIHLSDGTLHFRNADLRHFEWNRRRAMVIDLQNMSQYEDTDDNAETHLSMADFKVNAVQALWVTTALGDGSEKDFGISAIYLTNTAPVWGPGFIEAQTQADFIKGNDAPDQFYTICLPFNAAVCGAYAYSVKGADKEQMKVVLQRETGILKAGVPYILLSNV